MSLAKMPLYEKGKYLSIERGVHLVELGDIPATVTRIDIEECELPGYLISHLPAHVKILTLSYAKVTE